MMDSLLAAVTLSQQEIGLGVLALLSTLVGYHFLATKYIRQAAGVSESSSTAVSGDRRSGSEPLTVQAKVEFTPMTRFDRLESYVHEREHEILGKINLQGLALEERRQEWMARMSSLDDKLDRKFGEAIAANASSASKTHARIDALASVQGQLVGEMRHVAEAAREASRAAQAAALAAAGKGGGK